MTSNMDNDGPSDEEESSSMASHSISPLRASLTKNPPSRHDAPEKEFGDIPNGSHIEQQKQQQQQRSNNGDSLPVTKEGHKYKMIDISPPPPSTKRQHARYESFFPTHTRGRSPSTSIDDAETKKESTIRVHDKINNARKDRNRGDNKHKSGGAPARKQILRARQVLVHYHPQMGDEGYESTLLESSSSSSLHPAKYRGGFSSTPPPSSPIVGRRNGPGGGIHSRMIDDLRFLEGGGNDETDNAATRQLRRRVLRMTMDGRTRTLEEKLKRMRHAEEDVDGPLSEERNKNVGVSGDRDCGNGRASAAEESPTRRTRAEEGDIPLPAPERRSASRSVSSPSGRDGGRLPPPPPPDAHRQIVAQMIRTNEPEKLTQLDRVMQKYSGREEELIAKLDLRYRKKKKKKTTGGAAASNGNSTTNRHEEKSPVETAVRHSPRKDRNALLMMQNWDRKRDEKEYDDDNDDHEKKHATRKKNGSTAAAAMEQEEQDEQIDSCFLAVSARTSSTRTELHSNLERDVEDSEGRLPKVPESEAKVPDESEAMDRRNTPTRTKDGEQAQARHGSPGFNDDISLITMETKGTLYRNRGEGGGREGGGGGRVGVYSYAEMMRRPPASIIVDGNANTQPPQDSPASMEKDLDEHAESNPQEHHQLAPPKIQRLLPEYEKISEQEKANAAEASQTTSAILDSVEARIRARHELRREEEARKSVHDETGPSTITKETNAPEEQPTMAFDEEESFVGKSNPGGQQQFRGVTEHSSSLIDDEAERCDVYTGLDPARKEETAIEEDLVTNALKGDRDSFLGKSYQYERGSSFRVPALHKNWTDDEHDERGSTQPIPAHIVEKAISPDKKNDGVPVNVAKEGVYEDQGSGQHATKVVEDAQRQREEEQARAIQEAARRDAEIRLQKLEDEIARLVAEKESRFAAEKAVAIKKAEKALEEERKARLEAEEARVKAEKELERLKAEAEARAALTEAANVAVLLRAEQEKTSDVMSANVEESSMSVIDESGRSMPKAIMEEKEESMLINDKRSMPTNEDNDEQYVAKSAVTIEKSMSMDTETKEELMSMIAEMEERAISHSKHPSTVNETEDTDQDNNEDEDSVDIVEKMRSVWALDEDESQPAEYGVCSYDDSEYETHDDNVAESTNSMDGNDENDSDHSDDHSYLPGSLQSSPERKSITMSKDLHDFPSLTMPQGPLNLESLEHNIEFPRISSLKNDHDFPSMTMPHRQVSAAQILDTAERGSLEPKITSNLQYDLPRRPSVLDDEEGEANIYHIARVAFDGDPSKGQLSFTTGSEVLAHSNQRGDWWLGRCGSRTGWFPSSAVVPASEFLRGPVDTTYVAVQNAEDDDDIDLEFPKLSEEELNNVYDFIRSPSGDDDTPKKGSKFYSPPSSPILDPFQSVALKERQESTENNECDARNAFDSMMNVYDSMVTPASARNADQPINGKEQPSLIVSVDTKQSETKETNQTKTNLEQPAPNVQEKKPKRLWRSALDPNTGLTYYYHVKTRETTWDKPPDFVEKPPAAKSPTSVESKPVEQESGPKDATAKEPLKSGSKRLLSLFSKPSARRSDRKVTHPNMPQSTKPTNDYPTNTKNHASNHILSSPDDNSTNPPNDHQKEAKYHATKDIVSSPYDDSEDDDVSSVSSEETSTSIFSTKRMKEVIVKVTSKIAGKITTIPPNNSYDVLDDSDSRPLEGVKNVKNVEKLPATNADEETKEVIRPHVDRDESNRQVKSHPDHATMTPASAVKAALYGKNKDSRWHAAIDPLTGRTYFFHKDTQETVWKKPENI